MSARSSGAKWLASLAVDWNVNAGRPKSQMSLLLLRTTAYANHSLSAFNPLRVALAVIYRVLVEWVLGIEIPAQTAVGPRLRVYHGQGIVVSPHAIIGADVSLRQGVTIGNRHSDFDCPVVEDGVDFGAYSAALGAIRIGVNAKIGAHAVVLISVPDGVTAVGNQARLLIDEAHGA
ncbi:MAG TPA: serine acetyltransferase [Solirubrobacteraceae bacterium]|jgi:putative colanic acid biosynthesis acetyltransferase WcaB|nr:serine acetyltransferase [Solirubrobacteraceae bacterium]